MISNPLDQSIISIKGIGKQKESSFKEMGISTVRDLFNYYPYRYEDYNLVDLEEANNGDKVTVEGKIYSEPLVKRISKSRNLVSIRIIVENQILTATWFNRAFLKNQLIIGRPILLTGKWDKSRKQITVYESEFLDTKSTSKKGHLLPVYSLPSDFNQNYFRKIMLTAMQQYYTLIDDYLPDDIREHYKLPSLREAIKGLHFPSDYQEGKQAKRRLVYDELFLYQLKIQIYKQNNRQAWPGIKKRIEMDKINNLIENLPYQLTNAQNRVLKEILVDLESDFAMNRLLQGDVGSGKTVIAALSLYANYLAGFQGALMVPTEILAEQHSESLIGLLSAFGIEIGLLTGKLTEANRRGILGQLQMGLIDIVIGTHALIQEDVYFKNLGLVITDEQHRFGVEQRAILRKKGNEKIPDVLYMTATPIPRTLAITAFGDMDISTLDEYPAGRKKIETYWVKPDLFPRVVDFIEKEIKLGKQAYVICPLIEESEKLDVQNAIDVHAMLSNQLPKNKIGLMHGRLPNKEKDDIMQSFTNNDIQVLVSTTVVEVGVNVPNATLMVIYDAERFGLAQLHQLRGRVGRGNEQSYCILIADPKSETSKERMRIMTETNDGFEIARRDLELRGPGDFFGVKQSGMPDFKLANIVEDYRTLEVAKRDAEDLVLTQKLWNDSKWDKIREELIFHGIAESNTLEG